MSSCPNSAETTRASQRSRSGLSAGGQEVYRRSAGWEEFQAQSTGEESTVKSLQSQPGIFELTWQGNDGRATFDYGPEKRPGEPHIRWRRIGGHEILQNP